PGSSTVPGSVTIPAGATSATFTVLSSAVAAPSSTTIFATLGGPDRGIVLSAVLKVLPAATLSALTLNPTTVNAGTSSTGTVTLSGPAPAGGLGVTLPSNKATAAALAAMTGPAAGTSATFNVTAVTATP